MTAALIPSCPPVESDKGTHFPYLFILCMEYLVNLIEDKLRSRTWQGVRPARGSLYLTRLLFADDILLMGTTTPNTSSFIKTILDSFCEESGMKVRAKLAGWKSSMLSMAGRAVLINSTCAAIPSYFMQCSRLPKTTISNLDKINRDFLWGSTSDKKKLHLVSWEVITRPKSMGGLGIPNMDNRNKALLGNLVFKASTSHDPWACLLRHQFAASNLTRLRRGFSNWKAITIGMKVWNK
ncbi:hypothetical protein CRG98_033303 [Punica granatum]|uniref:Reverse transcriptase domain-containing protein n=1 Tax=Punica granatum TaxID=22663 RepID=A0A2I0IQR3_PUNGR|nr:hypothetical protein CRG98_033303 [Punica granatum]